MAVKGGSGSDSRQVIPRASSAPSSPGTQSLPRSGTLSRPRPSVSGGGPDAASSSSLRGAGTASPPAGGVVNARGEREPYLVLTGSPAGGRRDSLSSIGGDSFVPPPRRDSVDSRASDSGVDPDRSPRRASSSPSDALTRPDPVDASRTQMSVSAPAHPKETSMRPIDRDTRLSAVGQGGTDAGGHPLALDPSLTHYGKVNLPSATEPKLDTGGNIVATRKADKPFVEQEIKVKYKNGVLKLEIPGKSGGLGNMTRKYAAALSDQQIEAFQVSIGARLGIPPPETASRDQVFASFAASLNALQQSVPPGTVVSGFTFNPDGTLDVRTRPSTAPLGTRSAPSKVDSPLPNPNAIAAAGDPTPGTGFAPRPNVDDEVRYLLGMPPPPVVDPNSTTIARQGPPAADGETTVVRQRPPIVAPVAMVEEPDTRIVRRATSAPGRLPSAPARPAPVAVEHDVDPPQRAVLMPAAVVYHTERGPAPSPPQHAVVVYPPAPELEPAVATLVTVAAPKEERATVVRRTPPPSQVAAPLEEDRPLSPPPVLPRQEVAPPEPPMPAASEQAKREKARNDFTAEATRAARIMGHTFGDYARRIAFLPDEGGQLLSPVSSSPMADRTGVAAPKMTDVFDEPPGDGRKLFDVMNDLYEHKEMSTTVTSFQKANDFRRIGELQQTLRGDTYANIISGSLSASLTGDALALRAGQMKEYASLLAKYLGDPPASPSPHPDVV